jgi:hypothetical protein
MGVGYPNFCGHTIMPALRLPMGRPALVCGGAGRDGTGGSGGTVRPHNCGCLIKISNKSNLMNCAAPTCLYWFGEL